MPKLLITVLTFITSFWALAAHGQSRPPAEKSQWHRPAAAQAGRANILLATELSAQEGIGVSADYDIPIIADAGPGRLLGGPAGHFLFASDNDGERLGCDVTHQQQVISAGAQIRYVLDFHKTLRPWASAGVGVDFVRHSYQDDEPCAFDVNDTDTDIGPGFDVAIGIDIDLSPVSLLTFGVSSHSGQDDYGAVSIGLGWRF